MHILSVFFGVSMLFLCVCVCLCWKPNRNDDKSPLIINLNVTIDLQRTWPLFMPCNMRALFISLGLIQFFLLSTFAFIFANFMFICMPVVLVCMCDVVFFFFFFGKHLTNSNPLKTASNFDCLWIRFGFYFSTFGCSEGYGRNAPWIRDQFLKAIFKPF